MFSARRPAVLYLTLLSIIIVLLPFFRYLFQIVGSVTPKTALFASVVRRTYEWALHEYTHSRGHSRAPRLSHRGASGRANLRRITNTISSERAGTSRWGRPQYDLTSFERISPYSKPRRFLWCTTRCEKNSGLSIKFIYVCDRIDIINCCAILQAISHAILKDISTENNG